MKENKNIEILSEELLWLRDNEGYLIPEDYFSQLPEKLAERLDLERIEGISEINDVPKDYFETLPQIVMDRVEQKSPAKVRRLSRLSQAIGIAASLLIVGFIGSSIFSVNEVPVDDSEFAAEYMDYLEQNTDEFEMNSLIDYGLVDEEMMGSNLSLIEDNTLDYYLDINIDDINLEFLEEIK